MGEGGKVKCWGYGGVVELEDCVFMVIREGNMRGGDWGCVLLKGDKNER